MGKAITTRSGPAESHLELMQGAMKSTDPRTLDTTSGDDRPHLNAQAYPPDTQWWGPVITHEEYMPDVYPGVQGTWQLDNYDGKKGAR